MSRKKVGVLNVHIGYKILGNGEVGPNAKPFELVDKGKIALTGHTMENIVWQVKNALEEVDMLDSATVTVEMDKS